MSTGIFTKIGEREYPSRKAALLDESIRDEELAAFVKASDIPYVHICKNGKQQLRWDVSPFRTAWKHANAGPLTFLALRSAECPQARAVGFIHYKTLNTRDAVYRLLEAMVCDLDVRVRRYLCRSCGVHHYQVKEFAASRTMEWATHNIMLGEVVNAPPVASFVWPLVKNNLSTELVKLFEDKDEKCST